MMVEKEEEVENHGAALVSCVINNAFMKVIQHYIYTYYTILYYMN